MRTGVVGAAMRLSAEVKPIPRRGRVAVIAAGLGVVAIGAVGDGSGEEGSGTHSILVKFQAPEMVMLTVHVLTPP